MSRIYRPPWRLLNTPHISHRRLRCLFCEIIDGQILVLRFLRIQPKLPLPRVRSLFVEILEVFDKKRLRDPRLEMCDVHNSRRGVCGQEDQRVLIGSVRDPDLGSSYRDSVFRDKFEGCLAPERTLAHKNRGPVL